MSYLGSEKLKSLINDEAVIEPKPSDERMADRVKNGAYELSLGSEVFRTDSKDKKKEILKIDKELVTINPGQFALVLTEEQVNIPRNKIAFISIKAGIKLRGLINVSGFHVDPGFRGHLLFSVYNAGIMPISLEKGEPYFLIWFAELQLADKESTTYNGEHKNLNSIPAKYIDPLLMSELASPKVLLDKINENFTTLDSKATNREYLYKTGIGILIVVGLKLFLEWGVYEKGRANGYAQKQYEVVADTTLNNILREQKALLVEVDSLKRERQKLLLPPVKKKRN